LAAVSQRESMKKLIYFLSLLLLLIAAAGIAIVPNKPLVELTRKYTNAQSRFIELDGMRVHYRDEGEGDVVLLLHGTGSSLHTWDGWAESLSLHYRVIRLDLPGFGLTGPHPQRDYSISGYVNFLKGFADALQLERIALAGNSLGGAIAWHYSLAFPQQVERLILVDASGFPRAADKQPNLYRLGKTPLIKDIMQVVAPRSLYIKNLREVYYDHNKISDVLVDRYRDLSLREGNRQAMVDRINTRMRYQHEKLSQISAPTLIMWGKFDRWMEPTDADRFAQAIQNSKVIWYDAGHVPMEELPQQTAADALYFLQTS